MAVTLMRHDSEVRAFDEFARDEPCIIGELNQTDQDEVLDFLAARPIHTVFMASLIRDNGLISPHNRGSFYGSRDRQGQLEGVALLGHATLIEAQTENSLATFARLARNCLNANLIRGERETINRFWNHYANSGLEPRLICRELLFEQRQASVSPGPVDELRPAILDDLDQIVKINAAMFFKEGGISPLHRDPGGFRHRTARRIEQNRVWAWVDDGRLIFKADIVAETPQAIYLEGVYVHPEERMKGYGRRCLAQLSSILLTRSQSICLTVNEENKKARVFYEKAGYQVRSSYETIYLRQEPLDKVRSWKP